VIGITDKAGEVRSRILRVVAEWTRVSVGKLKVFCASSGLRVLEHLERKMTGCHGHGVVVEFIPDREANMARHFIDCRDYPSEMNCTVAISADSKKELVDAAVQHAVAVHRHQDTPELREQIEKLIKTE
jgi:predicted small metal-binding protein